MKKYIENLSKALLGVSYTELEEHQQNVINSIAEAEPIAENVNETFHEQLSFGQLLADKISSFGGSWTFIILFFVLLISWMMINTLYFVSPKEAFDPYPFILLNLVLSSLAALQAPIIMMTQNRQTAKDRMDIAENYKVSLKTDLEIIRLHQKIDSLIETLSTTNEKD
ncbi:MAG: DUF1003 domain-containing protein [Gammaproteobacteria bacterium]|nr:DUF1003 domain-containing protein [Gammaproteobacteria bacterium]